MMDRVTLAGLVVLLVALTGCSASAPSSGEPTSAGPTPTAAAPTPTPSATASAYAAAGGFTVPGTCDALVPIDLAASLAAQGLTPSEVEVFPEVPLGDPLPVSDFDAGVATTVTMTDYLNCQWAGAGRTITIFLGRVDASSRPLVVSEFWSFDRRIDRTAPVVTLTFDGMIPGVGQGPASHWVLRSNSEIKVDIDPGDEAARQLAQSIAEQVAATVLAD